MQVQTIKRWFQVHKWTSLVSTVFLLMLCITGLPLIFAHEIEHALGNEVELPVLDEVPDERPTVDEILDDALARYPGAHTQFLVGDHDPELLAVRLAPDIVTPEITAYLTYDRRTGELLQAYPLGEGFINFMLRLHVDMFLGLPGMLFLGFMGLLLTVSLVSGVVLYAPFMRRLTYGTVRRHRSRRIEWLDLHNLIGITTLVWLMVVGVTGVINTLSDPIFAGWQADQLQNIAETHGGGERVDAASASAAPVGAVFEAAMNAVPDSELEFMAFPGNPFATRQHYTVFLHGNTPITQNLLTVVVVDARSADVVEVREMPWYVQTLMVSQPLHFGDYGGMPLKILWAILDVLAIVVLGSGLYLWVARGRYRAEAPQELEMLEAAS